MYKKHNLLLSIWVKIFPGLYNFPKVHAILVVTPPAYALPVDIPPVKHATYVTYAALLQRKYLFCLLLEIDVYPVIPPTQRMLHFCWGICILFTFGNRCISCYATLATYAACQRNLPVNISQFFLMEFSLVQLLPCNLWQKC